LSVVGVFVFLCCILLLAAFCYEQTVNIVTTRAARIVLFSVVSVCVFVNTVTPEPLEVSSRNFQGSSCGGTGRQVQNWIRLECAGGERTYLMF